MQKQKAAVQGLASDVAESANLVRPQTASEGSRIEVSLILTPGFEVSNSCQSYFRRRVFERLPVKGCGSLMTQKQTENVKKSVYYAEQLLTVWCGVA